MSNLNNLLRKFQEYDLENPIIQLPLEEERLNHDDRITQAPSNTNTTDSGRRMQYEPSESVFSVNYLDFDEEKLIKASLSLPREEKYTKKFTEDPFYVKSTKDIMKKLIKQAENILENTVIHHLTKIDKKKIRDDEKQAYFPYIRNYLYDNKYISGLLYQLFVEKGIDSKKEMNEFTKIEVFSDKLKEAFAAVDGENFASSQPLPHLRRQHQSVSCLRTPA